MLTSSTLPGHLLRVLDLAQQLSVRGHRVLFKTKATASAEVAAAGAELMPYEHCVDLADRMAVFQLSQPPWWMPKIPFGIAMGRATVHTHGVQLARELEPILRRERVDCVVYDFFEFGAAWAAERVGVPAASAGNMGTALTPDELPLLFEELPAMKPLTRAPALAHGLLDQLMPLAPARAKLGLSPYEGRTADLVRAMISRELHIVMAHRGFAGGVPLRDHQAFVGPTSFNRASPIDEDAPQVAPGTVVVSTTTTGKDGGLFRRVLEAVAPLHVPILATAASADDIPSGLGDHVRITQYIPHDTAFPSARALITHGGWGTVGRALTHGLPMLVIPLFGDQILNATLVEHAKLGRHLPLAKASPEAIRAALQELLSDEEILARARHAADEIKRLKDDQVAARALERLVFEREAGRQTERPSRAAA
ncbi:glycosyltransferase [Chondromyces crocatus]|uniref:glycosyltransferase n=1 Tax=Chondromyces crocatus TaxID=52 RepID=UPI00067E3053|nr:glycosyltransferase [Chondromyces crocatus]